MFTVENTTKNQAKNFLHHISVTAGSVSVGEEISLRVNEERRFAIMRNHTAAHLLQAALRRLGHPALAQRLTDHIVRKLAHFCEYTLEGFLLMLCMRVYTRNYIWHISVPLLGGVLTALADETIQIYSPGRSSQVTDVWLDSAGVLAGILAALVLMALCGLLFHHRNKE